MADAAALVATATGPSGDGATAGPPLDDRRHVVVYVRDTLDRLVS